MCLTTITAEHDTPKQIFAYKIFERVADNDLRSPFHCRSVMYRVGVDYATMGVRNQFPEYMLGFHAFETIYDAWSYLCHTFDQSAIRRYMTVAKVRLLCETDGWEHNYGLSTRVVVGSRMTILRVAEPETMLWLSRRELQRRRAL